MNDHETLVCIDIESDGPVAGMHSMLAFAAVAFTTDGDILAEFSRNLQQLPEMQPHPDTMAWWQTQAEAWQVIRSAPQPPAQVMQDFAAWLAALPGKAVPGPIDVWFVDRVWRENSLEQGAAHAAQSFCASGL